MDNCYQKTGGTGAWFRGAASLALGATLLWPVFAHGQLLKPKTIEIPPALNDALGWTMPEKPQTYGSRADFSVGTEPAKWPAALEVSKAWAAHAPALEQAPAEHLFRRLARIQALSLAATDTGVLQELPVEREALRLALAKLREIKSDRNQEWRRRSALDAAGRVHDTLGEWLAESPEDRLRLFREALENRRPPTREQLAARYGGEERLSWLVERAKEYNRLMNEQQAIYRLPEAEQRKVEPTVSKALERFYSNPDNDPAWNDVLNDADLATEVGRHGMQQRLEVPENLVTWASEEEATRLLGEAYALPVNVDLASTSRTGVLARRLIVEGKIRPATVPWSLITWPESIVSEAAAADLVRLHDVLKARFDLATSGGDGNWRASSAKGVLALALASADRGEEARALIKNGKTQVGLPYRAQITPGMADAAWDLVMDTLDVTEVELRDSWEVLVQLAQVGNRRAELVAVAAKHMAAVGAESPAGRFWRDRYGWALIAKGEIDAGLAHVNAVLEAEQSEKKTGLRVRSDSLQRLFLLAKVLDRPEIVNPWMERLAAEFRKPKSAFWDDTSLFEIFARTKIARGETESLVNMLRARSAPPRTKAKSAFLLLLAQPAEDEISSYDRRFATIWLADVLGRLGRHDEVLKLLATSPTWDAKDLSAFITDTGDAGRALPLIVAESLNAETQSDKAIAILEAFVAANPGYDPGYELYTRLHGERAVPFLEKLYAANRFEERPLIWLASVKLAAGDVVGAETLAAQAVAIDPSDGEQPKGDRMRAYAVLREVAVEKGDAKQAEFLTGVLAAIRRSENADDFAQAGLAERAIEEYQLALESFADAYCIQSRLARELAEANRMDEAMVHYKRAFELMPDSFGRVESHCFGCEGAFAGEQAQGVAEQVFTEMAKQPDAKPQVQYLLGYLRYEQERWEEAAEHFARATEADPDYVNAWKKLLSVLPHTTRPRSEQDRVVFKLMELDPHGSMDGIMVRDIPALWAHFSKANETLSPTPKELFPLGEKTTAREEDAMMTNIGHEWDDTRMETVRKRLARLRVLQVIAEALESSRAWHADLR